jgi:hypothetical protein
MGEDWTDNMARSEELPFEDSIAQTLGVLKERKARGTTLIRVLEDYSRFRGDSKPMHRASRSVYTDAAVPKQELERLYLRRAAVDQVIRSIEAYSKTRLSA